MISLKSQREIELISKSADVLKKIFREVQSLVKPGVTTAELDDVCEKIILESGAVPAFKGYRGFPCTACISVNEEVVHGIPGARRLQAGDLVSLDIGCHKQGYYADAARTWPVGQVTEAAQKLADAAKKSFDAGVAAFREGARIGDLSAAIQASIEGDGFQVVRDYVGHGIGRNLHEEPQVPNYGEPGRGGLIQDGLALAIEPMVTEGHWAVKVLKDGWTVVTRDGKWSSHYEDTIVFWGGCVLNLTRE